MKKEILYGIHPVIEALSADRRKFFDINIAKGKTFRNFSNIQKLAISRGVNINRAEKTELDAMAGTRQHQGICASVSQYPFVDFSSFTATMGKNGTPPFLVLLDNIQDPHNLGAIIRTALCAGVNGIIIPKDRSAPPTPAVSRGSAGALEHMLMARVTNISIAIQALKKHGLWFFGLDMNGDKSVFAADLSGGIALIIGGEDKGIRPLVKKECDFLIFIPQKGEITSLNASAAGAVALYEAYRQRNIKRP